jgi:hypothetical protein
MTIALEDKVDETMVGRMAPVSGKDTLLKSVDYFLLTLGRKIAPEYININPFYHDQEAGLAAGYRIHLKETIPRIIQHLIHGYPDNDLGLTPALEDYDPEIGGENNQIFKLVVRNAVGQLPVRGVRAANLDKAVTDAINLYESNVKVSENSNLIGLNCIFKYFWDISAQNGH